MTNLSDNRHVLIQKGKVTMPVQEYAVDAWLKSGWKVVKDADSMQSEMEAAEEAKKAAAAVGAPVTGAPGKPAPAVPPAGDGDQKI